MKRTLQLISICILFIFISLYQLKVPALKAQDPLKKQTGFNFITRSKDILLDGNKEFRFIGLNTPNLHVEEDDRFLAKKWHRIDEYEIRDIFKTILVMGGSVTRTYVFSRQGGR